MALWEPCKANLFGLSTICKKPCAIRYSEKEAYRNEIVFEHLDILGQADCICDPFCDSLPLQEAKITVSQKAMAKAEINGNLDRHLRLVRECEREARFHEALQMSL